METSSPSLTVPLTFQVTEKDFLFPDVGKKAETMVVDLNGERVQNKVITVEVREKKPLSDEKRTWLLWREAVKRYGPGKDAYMKSVWDIYTRGIKREKNRTITLWIVALFMALIGSTFAYQSAQPSLAAMVMKTIVPEERPFIDGIQAEYASDQSLFWSIVARERDWWEELRVGRKNSSHIQWLKFDTYPTEQSILKVRFLTLRGFDKPILEVYGQTHAGNGALYLYEVGDTDLRLLLEVLGAVDVHNENAVRPEHQKQYGYFQCGEVIEGDTLTSEYSDLNSDGIDDLTLSGTTRVICEESTGFDERGYAQTKDVIVERREEKKHFIWDTTQRWYISQ